MKLGHHAAIALMLFWGSVVAYACDLVDKVLVDRSSIKDILLGTSLGDGIKKFALSRKNQNRLYVESNKLIKDYDGEFIGIEL